MNWNAEPPTEPGWYWHKFGDVRPADKAWICHVNLGEYLVDSDAEFQHGLYISSDSANDKPVVDIGGFWAGPIPEPGAVADRGGRMKAELKWVGRELLLGDVAVARIYEGVNSFRECEWFSHIAPPGTELRGGSEKTLEEAKAACEKSVRESLSGAEKK